jgi:hypothetical protein
MQDPQHLHPIRPVAVDHDVREPAHHRATHIAIARHQRVDVLSLVAHVLLADRDRSGDRHTYRWGASGGVLGVRPGCVQDREHVDPVRPSTGEDYVPESSSDSTLDIAVARQDPPDRYYPTGWQPGQAR